MRVRWSAAVPVCLAVAVLTLLAAAPADKKAPAPEPAKTKLAIVEITLRDVIKEQGAPLLPWGPSVTRLHDVTATLRKAASDPAVKAVILRLRQPRLGVAKIQEIADAIREVQAAKKKVYAYTSACGNGDYMLAACADKVVIPPGGAVALIGLGAEATFVKGMLDWLGIQADLLATGPHKSAGDALTRETMTEENRKVLDELLDDLYAQLVDTIAAGRGLEAKQVRTVIDGGPYAAKAAREAGLVDDLLYYDQFLASVGKDLGGEVDVKRAYHRMGRKGPDLSQTNLFTLFASLQPKPPIPKNDTPKVVIIYASGIIASGASLGEDVISADVMHKAFEAARKNDTVKAVVLRVDSPGGSAIESDIIWREVEHTQATGRPVIASLSDVAGSGGYYIVMGADAIVAQPASITGSIGVIGGKLVLKGLYDKIGVKKEIITRGKNAALFSDYAPFGDGERKHVKAFIGAIYDEFVEKAAAGRNMPKAKMLEFATGRVWTARKALDLGLVDRMGGLKEAYALAVEKAGLKGKKVEPVILPQEKSLFEALLGSQTRLAATAKILPNAVHRTFPYVRIVNLLEREMGLVLMPYLLEVR
ncbi:signal peptide peptidase SppA [bacterium]|nr:signal peptide peptidase SppA [bacterium]